MLNLEYVLLILHGHVDNDSIFIDEVQKCCVISTVTSLFILDRLHIHSLSGVVLCALEIDNVTLKKKV